MCGIAGIINIDGRPVDPARLRAMATAIAHRGPDDEGYLFIDPLNGTTASFAGKDSHPQAAALLPFLNEGTDRKRYSIGFAHRRFSIIDLSIAGHQPFIAHDETGWAITYNGEIYNYRELRKELESLGFPFISECDTEVALNAYRAWGVDCFDRFNGFWAMAIYDPHKRSVILSRDRLGVKPLYYAERDGTIAFASEIKALLALPEMHTAVAPDRFVVRDWLAAGIKNHTDATFFWGIRSFPAGSWAMAGPTLRDRIRHFWTLPLKRLSVRELPLEKAMARLRELLVDAIRLRLRADVPLAVSLSGGIDSSTIVALAKRDLGVSLPSFTVRFKEPEADESVYAAAVSAACGSEQTWIDAPSGSLWRDIAAFTALLEEPYHAPNVYTDQQVWSVMRAHGIKVALNGAAGDENFGGYGYHYSLMQLRRLLRGDLTGFALEAARCRDSASRLEAFLKPIAYALKERVLNGNRRSLDIDARLWQDMRFTLMPYWLSVGDRNCMGLPIEIREPFLDYRIVAFAFSLPLDYLVHDGWQKWIVRKTVEPLLPAEVVWRKRKMGFPYPFTRFFNESKGIVDLIHQNGVLKTCGRIKRKYCLAGWPGISYLLWHAWFFNQNHELFDRIREQAWGENVWAARPAYLANKPASWPLE
jgi:asparagine synthase (glutamine-hydrolysing)